MSQSSSDVDRHTSWRRGGSLIGAVILWLLPVVSAHALLIDLNDFYSFPGDPVAVSPDGTTAVIGDNPDVPTVPPTVTLTNDPFFGDPNVIDPTAGSTLVFHYDFEQLDLCACGAFVATLFDSDIGLIGAGILDSFGTFDAMAGFIAFDISAYAGRVLGLQFEVQDLDGIRGTSRVTITNVAIVPEPESISLLLAGLLAVFMRARRSNT